MRYDLCEDKNELVHYKFQAKKYDENLFFGSGYRAWLADFIVQFLDLKKNDIVIDLAGGTGIFSKIIHEKAGLDEKITCIDSCNEMLKEAENYENVQTLCDNALSFSQRKDIKYDKILIKEAVHHFEKRESIFLGIYNQLCEDGKILIVTRPRQPEFPFFKTAAEAFAKIQPDCNLVIAELENSGFIVDLHTKSYPLKVDKNRWFELIKNRFMSNLSQFDDKNLDCGIRELEIEYKAANTLDFKDVLIFLVGTKLGLA